MTISSNYLGSVCEEIQYPIAAVVLKANVFSNQVHGGFYMKT